MFQVWKNNLLKINITFIINFERKKERLSFSVAVVRNCSIRNIARKFFAKVNLQPYYKRDSDTGVFCEFIKFFNKAYLAEHLQIVGSRF